MKNFFKWFTLKPDISKNLDTYYPPPLYFYEQGKPLTREELDNLRAEVQKLVKAPTRYVATRSPAVTTPVPVTIEVTPVQAVNLLNGLNELLGLWQGKQILTEKFVVATNVNELTTFRNDLAALLKEKGLK